VDFDPTILTSQVGGQQHQVPGERHEQRPRFQFDQAKQLVLIKTGLTAVDGGIFWDELFRRGILYLQLVVENVFFKIYLINFSYFLVIIIFLFI